MPPKLLGMNRAKVILSESVDFTFNHCYPVTSVL